MALVQFENNSVPYINANNLNKIQEGNIYSTDEVEIGLYNNKKYYRKIIAYNYSITGGQEITINTNLNNIDDIKISGYCKSGTLKLPINFYGLYDGNFKNNYCYLLDNVIHVYVTYNGYATIVLEYTKTTD